jgi:hypothetical protein
MAARAAPRLSFQLVNTFVIVTLNDLYQTVKCVIDSPSLIFTILGQTIPLVSTYASSLIAGMRTLWGLYCTCTGKFHHSSKANSPAKTPHTRS